MTTSFSPDPVRAGRLQEEAPYLDALLAYSERDPCRMHVPGHKGGSGADTRLVEVLGAQALEIDIPSFTEGVDLGSPPTPLQSALALAAEAWGARRSWFLLNGASEGGLAVCLALAQGGDRVIVQRNVHISTIHGAVLAGLRPAFLVPEIDTELHIAHTPTPESLDRLLVANPDARAAIVVSPTYFGATADVRSLAEVAHGRGVNLVVDEAWGAHLRFHEDLPEDALSAGADAVVHGTHKVVGSLTQSALLHLGHLAAPPLDEAGISHALSVVQTTSPSSLLIASLDAARRQAAIHGRSILDDTLREVALVRDALEAMPGVALLDRRMAGRPGIHDFDPLRLTVDVRGLRCSGFELARRLREVSDLHLELVTETVVVPHFGIADGRTAHGDAVVDAFTAAVDQNRLVAIPDRPGPRFARPPVYGPLVLTPREAYFAPHHEVELDDAVDEVAAESLSVYPPGIAVTVPGERLTVETVRYVQRTLRRGGTLRAIGGESSDRIKVVRPRATAELSEASAGEGVVVGPASPFERFPARAYLRKYYSDVGPENAAMARAILDGVTRHGGATDTVVEVGGGPSLLGMMALAAHRTRPFERVTFTDLATQNLAEVRSWLDDEPDCFDYGHVLRWLERANGATAGHIVDTLRCSNWELEETDWRMPVRSAWLRTYDVVSSHFFVESVTRAEDEFLELLAKVGRLARPGGSILLSLLWGSTGYPVAGVEFPALSLEPEAVPDLIEKAGLDLLDLNMTTVAAEDPSGDPGYGGLIFVSGRRPEALS